MAHGDRAAFGFVTPRPTVRGRASALAGVLLISGCSGEEPSAAAAARRDAAAGGASMGGVTTGGAPTGGVGGAPPSDGAAGAGGSGGFTPHPFTPVFRGIVVDASTGTGFDPSKYTRLPGVEVCVYGDSTLPCATTTSTGDYEFDGTPQNEPFYFSYVKAGFDSVLYPVIASAPGSYSAPFIVMAPTSFSDDFARRAGVARDATMGRIHFAAVTPGSPSDSPFFQVFGNAGFIYLKGYRVGLSPAPSQGPFYVSSAWQVDPSLTESSEAGWGFVATTPGDYVLRFTHPTLDCGRTDTKVVAGYSTVYVGTVCSPSIDAGNDAGVHQDAGADASPSRDAGNEGG